MRNRISYPMTKRVPLFWAVFILSAMFVMPVAGKAQSAKEIVARANDIMHGKSSRAVAVMTVVKPDWTRTMTTKLWMLEPNYALILITDPAKDKGTVTLKRKTEIWNWIPTIERVIKIPPSMMLQPWMGSDFTNDDLVRESSIVEDYNQTLVGEEKIDGYDCYKIKLLPKPEAGVVWGKVMMWISKKGYLELRTEYYDEDGTLVKYMTGTKVKTLGDRVLPSYWEMVPVDKPHEKTILEYTSMEFNVGITPSFFSEQNMKRVR
jgi:outer membrane lipoprotein-sorting protein